MPAITIAGITERLEPGETDLYHKVIERVEKELITAVLVHHHGNRTLAAKSLGITRFTLRKKMQQLGIHVQPAVEALIPQAAT